MHPTQPPIETPEEVLASYQWELADRKFKAVEKKTNIVIDADGDNDEVMVNVRFFGLNIDGLSSAVHDKLLEAAKAIREVW